MVPWNRSRQMLQNGVLIVSNGPILTLFRSRQSYQEPRFLNENSINSTLLSLPSLQPRLRPRPTGRDGRAGAPCDRQILLRGGAAARRRSAIRRVEYPR